MIAAGIGRLETVVLHPRPLTDPAGSATPLTHFGVWIRPPTEQGAGKPQEGLEMLGGVVHA